MMKNFIPILTLTIASALSGGSGPKSVEWRPKGSVPIPAASYVLAGKLVSKKINLWHTTGGFMLKDDKSAWRKVHPENCDEVARSMDRKRAAQFIQSNGRFIVNTYEDGSYALKTYATGLGGKHLTGTLLYWGTKFIGYLAVAKLAYSMTDAVSTENSPGIEAAVGQAAETAMRVLVPPLPAGTDQILDFMVDRTTNMRPEDAGGIVVGGLSVAYQAGTKIEEVLEGVACTMRSIGNAIPWLP